jgi:multidrug efflux pump subunit AcrA (membrane-fusion protein)
VKRLLIVVIVAGALAAAGYGAWRLGGSTTQVIGDAGPVVPTTRVTRGALELSVRMSGELRATRQMQLSAPAVGGQLRILSMADTGIPVKAGDPVMEFDPSDQLFALETSKSELLEAEQEIIKRQAELEVQAATDKVTLLTAQFDVRRAELDAMVDETIVAANEAKVRQVSLAQAKRHLVQVEQDVASRQTTTKAALAILNERRMKASMAADRAQQSIDGLELKSPMDGVVVVQSNMDALGGMVIFGMAMPTYRVGDTVNSGRLVADIFDVSSLEVRARVNEQERANVQVGQTAVVLSDAVAGLSQQATVVSIAGLGRADSRSGPLRQFDVILTMAAPDPRMRPGTTVTVITEGRKLDNLLIVPRQCVFERAGKSIVLARDGASFTPREVKVLHRTEGRIAIEGVEDGLEVALVDPDQVARPAQGPAAPPRPPTPGGPAGVSK